MREVDKIAYITNARMPTEKAHGLQIAKMCEAFAGLGIDVSLHVPSRNNDIQKNIFSYYSINPDSFSFYEISVPDVIRFSGLIGSLAYRLQMLLFLVRLLFFAPVEDTLIYTRNPEIGWLYSWRGYTTVVEVHRPPESYQSLFKRILATVDCVVCNSEGTESALNEIGVSNTIVAPNGVDLESFDITLSKSAAREKTNLPHDKTILLYTGSLYEWKGVDFVIEAWNKELAQDTDLFLVFVGGHEEDRKRLEEKLTRAADRVSFIPPVRHEQVPTYLKAADALLLPNTAENSESKNYTSPIKVFEYMSAKRPIIAANLPSITEVLSDETAFMFESCNSNSFSGNIYEAVSDKSKSNKKVENASKAVQKYTWNKRAENIISHFK